MSGTSPWKLVAIPLPSDRMSPFDRSAARAPFSVRPVAPFDARHPAPSNPYEGTSADLGRRSRLLGIQSHRPHLVGSGWHSSASERRAFLGSVCGLPRHRARRVPTLSATRSRPDPFQPILDSSNSVLSLSVISATHTGFSTHAALAVGGKIVESYPSAQGAAKTISKFGEYGTKYALKALTSHQGSIVGFYALTPTHRLRMVLFPTIANVASEGDPPVTRLLGTSSNYPDMPRLVVVDPAVVDCVIMLVGADAVQPNAFPVGEKFTKSDQPIFADHIDDDAEYRLVSVRCCAPVLKGYSPASGGNQADTNFAELGLVPGSLAQWYAMHTENWIPEVHVTAMDNRTDLGVHFPKLKKNTDFRESNTFAFTSVDEDLEVALSDDVQLITDACEAVKAHNLREAASTRSEASASVPRNVTTSGASSPSADISGVGDDISTGDGLSSPSPPSSYNLARFKIALSFRQGGSIHPPVFTEAGQDIFACSSVKTMNQMFLDLLLDTEGTVEDSLSLLRLVDVNHLTLPMAALLAQGMFKSTVTTNLRDCVSKKAEGWTWLWLLPVHQTSASNAGSDRKLEEILGEDPRRMSRLDTSVVATARIRGLADCITLLVNTVYVIGQVVDTSKGTPFLFDAANEILVELTDSTFRRRFDEAISENPHLPYWLAANFERIACKSGGLRTKRASALRHAQNGNWSKISVKDIEPVERDLEKFIGSLCDFRDGGAIPDPPEMFRHTEEKKLLDAEARRKQESLLRELVGRKRGSPALGETPPKERKRQTTVRESQSKEGDIIFDGPLSQRMPLPIMKNKDEIPCAPYYRDGQICRHPDRCRYCHKPIDELSPESQKLWIAHVKSNSSLSFNPKRVEIAKSGLDHVKSEEVKTPPKK